MADQITTYHLPAKHTRDWLDRIGREAGAVVVGASARAMTVELSPSLVADLRADAEYYAQCMGPEDTGDIDYRPAARRVIAALDRIDGASA